MEQSEAGMNVSNLVCVLSSLTTVFVFPSWNSFLVKGPATQLLEVDSVSLAKSSQTGNAAVDGNTAGQSFCYSLKSSCYFFLGL